MHSLCETPRIRFSGWSQFSRLVRWGCRYRKPSRVNFNGEENLASYFEPETRNPTRIFHGNREIEFFFLGNKRQNRVEIVVGQLGWNLEINEFFSISDISTRCKPINKFDWQQMRRGTKSKDRSSCAMRAQMAFHRALDRVIDRFEFSKTTLDSRYWRTLSMKYDSFYCRSVR